MPIMSPLSPSPFSLSLLSKPLEEQNHHGYTFYSLCIDDSCNRNTSSARSYHHHHHHSEQEQHELTASPVTSPPPELKRVSLPAMLAGGLFLFAASVQSSQRSRAEIMLRLTQEALRSDPAVTMARPWYRSWQCVRFWNNKVVNVDQLVMQFQINGGNTWAQGVLYGVEDENGLRLISLKVVANRMQC